MLQAPIQLPSSPHVIVVGNEKGGSGKTTVAMHIVVALMKAGQRVAAIDLDSRQKSLTRYIANRGAWAKRTQAMLELPVHFIVARAEGAKLGEKRLPSSPIFDRVITAVQHCHFLVIDTPPHDSYLMRLAHSIADTLVSTLNDSFLDLDVLAVPSSRWRLLSSQVMERLMPGAKVSRWRIASGRDREARAILNFETDCQIAPLHHRPANDRGKLARARAQPQSSATMSPWDARSSYRLRIVTAAG